MDIVLFIVFALIFITPYFIAFYFRCRKPIITELILAFILGFAVASFFYSIIDILYHDYGLEGAIIELWMFILIIIALINSIWLRRSLRKKRVELQGKSQHIYLFIALILGILLSTILYWGSIENFVEKRNISAAIKTKYQEAVKKSPIVDIGETITLTPEQPAFKLNSSKGLLVEDIVKRNDKFLQPHWLGCDFNYYVSSGRSGISYLYSKNYEIMIEKNTCAQLKDCDTNTLNLEITHCNPNLMYR